MENKRTAKIIKKKNLSWWVKPAKKDSDIIDFVIIEYLKCLNYSILFKIEDYIEVVNRGEYIPGELIHYVTFHNKRDRQTIANNLITNKYASIMYKNFPGKYPY